MVFATRATRIPRKTVDVDIEGETFRLREMNGLERDQYEIAAFKVEGEKRTIDVLLLRARLVVKCWVDEAGKRVYSDDEAEQFATEFPAGVINTLFDAGQKLNGMEAKAVENAAKNSSSVPADALSSDLH